MSRPQQAVPAPKYNSNTATATATAPVQSSPAPAPASDRFLLGPKLDRFESLVFAHQRRPIYPTDPQLIFL
jgi:hypothetical protein